MVMPIGTPFLKEKLIINQKKTDGYLQDHILSFPKMYIFGIFIID